MAMSAPDGTMDVRLHAYLDGELTPDEARAFELAVEADADLRRRLAALSAMDGWIRATRPEAPPSILAGVRDRLVREREGRAWDWTRFARRWRWAAAAAAVFLLVSVSLLLRAGGPRDMATGGRRGTETAPASGGGTVAHEFMIDAGDAREVCLVGDFNRWTVCATPLDRGPDGLWRVRAELAPGRHEYMFVVDRVWRTDPGARLLVDDGFGNQNAVIVL
jgi:hypothetical protein